MDFHERFFHSRFCDYIQPHDLTRRTREGSSFENIGDRLYRIYWLTFM